jgi:glycosyltransferase involved in cell wall biosynthesis
MKRRRRLCMVVHGPFPPDPRVSRAAEVALAEGWDVDVLATRQPGQSAIERLGGARVIRLPIAHRWGAGPFHAVREYLGFTLLATVRVAKRAARQRYSVVHVNNPPDFLILAAIVPKLLGAKVIFDVHDLSPDMFAMRFGNRRGATISDRILRLVERSATRLADFVLTVHEPYQRELMTRGVPPEKITVVMNSVDEHLLPPPRRAATADSFRVVYQGTITPPYGVRLLVEAVANIAEDLPEIQLEIYGDGDSLPEVRGLAEKLGINRRVSLSGRFLPHEEVLERIQAASVGVVPNLPTPLNRFALSTKLFEYVALGIPVISADLPTIREHFNDSEVLFFRAGDLDALTAALLEIRREPQAAVARMKAARRRYARYRWPLHARRYADMLERCLEPAGDLAERHVASS